MKVSVTFDLNRDELEWCYFALSHMLECENLSGSEYETAKRAMVKMYALAFGEVGPPADE